MSRLIFFVVQRSGSECSTSTQAKNTTKVRELKTIFWRQARRRRPTRSPVTAPRSFRHHEWRGSGAQAPTVHARRPFQIRSAPDDAPYESRYEVAGGVVRMTASARRFNSSGGT